MKTIFLFLITGFEEIEALATVDVLRRAGLPVRTVSLTDERTVTGSHGIPVVADGLFERPISAWRRCWLSPAELPLSTAMRG